MVLKNCPEVREVIGDSRLHCDVAILVVHQS